MLNMFDGSPESYLKWVCLSVCGTDWQANEQMRLTGFSIPYYDLFDNAP
jgi:hypothetical protein